MTLAAALPVLPELPAGVAAARALTSGLPDNNNNSNGVSVSLQAPAGHHPSWMEMS